MNRIISEKVKSFLLNGNFGIERENLRVTPDGFLSHSPHPFQNFPEIVQDFCENQIEVNTRVCPSVEAAVNELTLLTRKIYDRFKKQHLPELLWPFSNPPYIIDENDIPIADYSDKDAPKRIYRDYLAAKYGKYKMTFSGIHFNFSFGDRLADAMYEEYTTSSAAAACKLSKNDFMDKIYLNAAASLAKYGWVITLLTASSPVIDSSFVMRKMTGSSLFTGFSSLRCSEAGYWNNFNPVFDYSSTAAYAASIEKYIQKQFLREPSELYFPIRLKGAGSNSLSHLKNGINRIELRMFDLNPFYPAGIDARDLSFAHLLIIWAAFQSSFLPSESNQLFYTQNFKAAAHFDLDIAKIHLPDEGTFSAREAGLIVIRKLIDFYDSLKLAENEKYIMPILRFEEDKLTGKIKRPAEQAAEDYSDDYVKKGINLALKYKTILAT